MFSLGDLGNQEPEFMDFLNLADRFVSKLTEVGHPAGPGCDGDHHLLMGEIKWHRQLTWKLTFSKLMMT